jgi:group I intron endonuclease
MNYPDAAYIYAITNKVNGHMYIGSTVNYTGRWNTHRSTLKRGVHHSFILQKAWDKYGAESFTFSVLLVCPKDLRIEYEKRLMPLEHYNVLRTPKETPIRASRKHSEQTKQKMSAAHKGKIFTDTHRANMADAARKRVYTEEFAEKARKRMLGNKPNDVTRARLSAANSGRIFSDTHKAKLSEAALKQGIQKRISILEKIAKVDAMLATGVPVYKALKVYKMSSATYYKYTKHKLAGETS